MSFLGYITLAIFLSIIVLTLFRKITLPIQTVLVLISVIILVVGGVFRFFAEGLNSVLLLPNEMMGGIILHPITALLAGLFLAGALSASGGFEALKQILGWIQKTPIGLAGTLVIITQIPLYNLASLWSNHWSGVIAASFFVWGRRRDGDLNQVSIDCIYWGLWKKRFWFLRTFAYRRGRTDWRRFSGGPFCNRL